MVSAAESYPGRLSRLLEERAPGVFAVVNLGIPGQSTTETRDRLRDALRTYRPDLVIVWCGVNNVWNRGRSNGATGWRPAIDRLLSEMRLVRLVRVWRHDLTLERLLHRSDPNHAPERYDIVIDPAGPKGFVVRKGEYEEHLQYEDSGFGGYADMEARAERDYRDMISDSRASGARIVFIAYPVDEGAFQLANRALRRVAAETDAPVVEAARAILRVPTEERTFLWAGHPNGAMYTEVARDLVPIVLGQIGEDAGVDPRSATFSNGSDLPLDRKR
jgi:lysophospholipase L1-like esterase